MRLQNTPNACRVARTAVPALVAVGVLAGCVAAPPPRVAAAPPPPEPPRVYFYPTQGQSPEQQERDRYECYNWAVKQTGFDPSRSAGPPEERVAIVPAPAPGANTMGGAITGAIIGAMVSNPRNAGGGALIGAAAGGLLGAAADNAQAEQVQRIQTVRGNNARYQRDSNEYRRAMAACLEGRGYSVK